MKTNTIFILPLLFILICSCGKETAEVIPPDPEIDTWQLAKEYIQDLSRIPEGWIIKYQPVKEGTTYTIHIKFNSNNTASILSDYPNLNYLQEQSGVNFSLTGSLNTKLTFNTYCVWHKMYDDLGGDYKFIITRQTDGSFLLQTENKAEIRFYDLIKADPKAISELEESIAGQKVIVGAQNKRIKIRNMLYHFMEDNSSYFKNISLIKEGISIMQGAISFDTENDQLTVIYRDGNNKLTSLSENYQISEDGITLETPIIFGENTISGFELHEKENCNDIRITSAETGISGEATISKRPGVMPYPDIARDYTTQPTMCLLYTCKGGTLTDAYNELFTSDITTFYIFSSYYNPPRFGWCIRDSKYPGDDAWFYATAATPTSYSVEYTGYSISKPDRYPDAFWSLYCSEHIVLYKKKKYNDQDMGSIILMDPDNNANQFILRVTSSSTHWQTIDWNNVAYAE